MPVYFKRIKDTGACNSSEFKGGYRASLVWLWSVYNHISFWQVSFRIWHPLKEGTIAATVWVTRIMIEQMRCFFSLVPVRPWWTEFILQNSFRLIPVMFLWYKGHPLLFCTVTSLNLPQPSNRTLPWTWGLIVQRCLPSLVSARCACLCGSGSWHRPRCGIGSLFPPQCETGSLCLPRCETGSSVLPKRLRWSQKRCGTSSTWSC